MDTPQETTLYGKLAKIMGEIKYIPKKGKNTHFNYSFATEGDISDAIRKLLSDHNIAIFASMTGRSQSATGNTIKTICDFEFTLACGDTGATHVCLWSAEANDNQDKGFNKAATAAMKYWLLKTFMIPTGDDPDGDNEPAQKGDKKTPPPAPPARPQQKAPPAKATPAPQPAPAATQPPAEPATDYSALEVEERRKAATALDNELITIRKVTYKPTHNGMGAPSWLALAYDINGTSIPVTVGERGVKLVKKAGYDWPATDGDNLDIEVITEAVDGKRRILSVKAIDGTMVAETPHETPTSQPDATVSLDWGLIWPKVRPLYKSDSYMRNSVEKLRKEGAFKDCPDESAAIAVIVGHKNGQAEGQPA